MRGSKLWWLRNGQNYGGYEILVTRNSFFFFNFDLIQVQCESAQKSAELSGTPFMNLQSTRDFAVTCWINETFAFVTLSLYIVTLSRDFASGFFHESSSPKPLKITLGSFQIFSKLVETFASQVAPMESTINNNSGKFATGMNNTGGKFCHRYQQHRRQILLPVPLVYGAELT